MSRARNHRAASGRGRAKGSRSGITNEAKAAILAAFDKLGGVDRLVAWVKEDKANEALYWTKIFPKLLPRPAIEAAPPPEPAPPEKGVYTWITPKWAKDLAKAQEAKARKAERAGRAAVADAELTTEPWTGGTGALDDDWDL